MARDRRTVSPSDAAGLHARACTGDAAALARLLSFTEADPAAAGATFWQHAGVAHVVGITGAPGAGKSTITSALIHALRARGARIAVLAVDPSSPYTGGAILGDRIRMSTHALDEHVFIRSVATRGSHGGLAAAVPPAIRLLETVGFDYVLVETVGVGQIELEIAQYADTVLVVLTPGWGDGIQANKSGILEIADVFVINKADWPRAKEAVAELKTAQSLQMAAHAGAGHDAATPIVETVATGGLGIDELVATIEAHWAVLTADDGELLGRRREESARAHVAELIAAAFEQQRRALLTTAEFAAAATAVSTRHDDPWAAAQAVIAADTAVPKRAAPAPEQDTVV